MKFGMKTTSGELVFTPNQVASMRLSIAALVLLPISLRAIRRLKWDDLKWILVVGLVGSGIPAFLFTNSQVHLDSSVAGILNSLTPLFTLILGIALFRKPAEPRQVVGVLIGLSGAIALVSLKGFGSTSHWEYSILIVLATISYGFSVNTVQSKLKHVKALEITALSLLAAGIPWNSVFDLCPQFGGNRNSSDQPKRLKIVGFRLYFSHWRNCYGQYDVFLAHTADLGAHRILRNLPNALSIC